MSYIPASSSEHEFDHNQEASDTSKDSSTEQSLIQTLQAKLDGHRQIEKLLRDSEEYHRALLQQLPIGVALCRLDGTLIDFNPCFSQVLGLSAKELLTRNYWEIITTNTPQASIHILQAVMQHQHYGPYETMLQSNNGNVMVRLSGLIVEKHGEQLIWSSIEDITDRHLIEDALRKSEERFRCLVEATSQIIWVTDAKGHFISEQTQWSNFTGQTIAEIEGWGWLNAVHPDERLATAELWSRCVMAQIPYENEHRLRRFDGVYRHMSVRAIPITEPNGTLREWVGIYSDITERKEAQEFLQQQTNELSATLHELKQTQMQLIQSEKMSSLGQLVAGVAHEINNPVSFIYGNLSHAARYAQDLLHLLELYQKEYTQPSPELAIEIESLDLPFLTKDFLKLLESMRIGAERIRSIVQSLRNFSRLDQAESKMIDIHEGLDSTLMILQNRLRPHGDYPAVKIAKEYGDLPLIECYAGQLNQVFMNILSNAIDALEEKFKQSQNQDASSLIPTISIHTQIIDAEWVRIAIADNGAGMSETIAQKIFDPFFTTKPVGKGTGLGMSISYQIITEGHHGRLQCHSTLMHGTEFVIELPMHQGKKS
ncbi:MAG: PAS domain S-box protein [Pseudanabaenaceae cyanobacterium]|jgi:two-component system NtrC family sensor kinase